MFSLCCIVVVCLCDVYAHGCIHMWLCVCVLYAFMELFSQNFEIFESTKLLPINAEQLATET